MEIKYKLTTYGVVFSEREIRLLRDALSCLDKDLDSKEMETRSKDSYLCESLINRLNEALQVRE